MIQIIKIGKVTHFYDKIGVAIVELSGGLTLGDTIKFIRGGEDLFEQKVDSIQMEHNKVDFADAGSMVGLKLPQPVKEDTEVFKL